MAEHLVANQNVVRSSRIIRSRRLDAETVMLGHYGRQYQRNRVLETPACEFLPPRLSLVRKTETAPGERERPKPNHFYKGAIMNMTNDNKQLRAVSTATYRKVQIITTALGCTFYWMGRKYDCQSLSEATAAIDAIYARLANVISPTGIIK